MTMSTHEKANDTSSQVTEEMVQAGLSVLEGSGRLYGDGSLASSDGLLVRDIYYAMVREGLRREGKSLEV